MFTKMYCISRNYIRLQKVKYFVSPNFCSKNAFTGKPLVVHRVEPCIAASCHGYSEQNVQFLEN